MELKQVSLMSAPEGDYVQIVFTVAGEGKTLSLPVPVGWAGWTREEKISWATAEVEDHLVDTTYVLPGQEVFPDNSAPGQAKDDFRVLPGWADWTAAQASDWIDANVVDLASAKTVLTSMAKAIVYLRDIAIEK
jgi:hypothetical protein